MQPKVKLFILRACSNILPTQGNLFKRGVSNSFSCLWCEEEVEAASHALWQCDFAQRVWKASSIFFPSDCVSSLCFSDVIFSCAQSVFHRSLVIMFTTAWKLWQARNSLLWDVALSTVEDISQGAAAMALDFLESRLEIHYAGGQVEVADGERWRPPEQGLFKLNIDWSTSSLAN